jgi:extracellular factor (EF) 3-hydroxypalmitic acid methyl ester biosynthesis protein
MQTLTNEAVLTNAPKIQEQTVLDVAADLVRRGHIDLGLNDLFEDLRTRQEDSETWLGYAADCMDHPLRRLLHQDPFTYRAFSKPRGYAGDAVMMDYIYGMGQAGQAAREATPLGRAIFQYMDTRPSARAVRFRRELIAGLIDETVERGGNSVLAIAAGHLREAEVSNALQSGKVQNFVALDQDVSSLAVVDQDYAELGVRTMEGSVRQILSGKVKPGQFDFVYAAGLFDYLNASAAAALTRRMWEMTRPGGLMLIPNFLVGVRDRGYMESFMDWHLIYRDHADMQSLVNVLPASEVAGSRIFDDSDSAITFLLVTKAR